MKLIWKKTKLSYSRSYLIVFLSTSIILLSLHTSIQGQSMVVDIIDQIERNTDLVFNYERDSLLGYQFNGEIPADIGDHFINHLLKDTPFDYSRSGNAVLIYKLAQKAYQICGTVMDAISHELLPYAAVQIENTSIGVETNEDGFFQLTHSLNDKQKLKISYLGYTALVKPITDFSNGCLDLSITPDQNILTQPIVITDYLMQDIEKGQSYGSINLNYDQFTKKKSSVEHDVLRTLQLLPGITSTDESATQLNIRGSSPDQNLILWENAPLYEPGHLFGMISSINPYVIKDVKLYKDGFHPKNDNRVGALIDLSLHDEITNKINGGIGTTLTEGHAHISLPIVKNHLSIIAAGRKSNYGLYNSFTYKAYTQKIFQNTKIEAQQDDIKEGEIASNNSIDYHDYNIKVLFKPLNNLSIQSSIFKNQNMFSYSAEPSYDDIESSDVVDYSVQAISSELQYRIARNHEIDMRYTKSASINKFSFELLNTEEEQMINMTDVFNEINDEFYELSYTFRPSPAINLSAGFIHNTKLVAYSINEVNQYEEDIDEDSEADEKFNNTYVTASGAIGRFSYNAGARLTNQFNSDIFYWSPRIHIQYQLSTSVHVSVAASRLYQFINKLEEFGDFDLNLNGDIWVLREAPHDPVINAKKASIGLIYDKDDWLVDLSGYVGENQNLYILSTSIGPDVDPFETGSSMVSGIDLLLNKRTGPLQSWVNYSISQNNYLFTDLSPNNFAAPNDQRHRLNFINKLNLGNFQFSLNYQYKTGLPYSRAIGLEPDEPDTNSDEYKIIYSSINQDRLPEYHRLDAGVTFLRKYQTVNIELGFSLLNLLNSQNTFSRNAFIDENDDDELILITSERRLLKRLPLFTIRCFW